MAEPFAAGVLNSLLQPRAAQLNALARVARAPSQPPAVPATFFTPAPRQGKQRARPPAPPASVGQHVLGCQAWACPPSKQEVWGHGACSFVWGRVRHADGRLLRRRGDADGADGRNCACGKCYKGPGQADVEDESGAVSPGAQAGGVEAVPCVVAALGPACARLQPLAVIQRCSYPASFA